MLLFLDRMNGMDRILLIKTIASFVFLCEEKKKRGILWHGPYRTDPARAG